LEAPVVEILEPTQPPPLTAEIKPEDEPKDMDKSDAPKFVAVTLDTPAISFSVPSIGNVLVPNAVAVAPPAAPLQQRATAVASAPKTLENTGEGGDRPKPTEYPRLAQQLGQHGAVTLLLTADEAGVLTDVIIKESSGFPILDRAAREWVKVHWTVSPGTRGRLYEATISYVLK
jgi:protein TonB